MPDISNGYPPLQQGYETLRAAVMDIPDNRFTAPMSGWSPRDVVAHLIGWNRRMITACQSILKGQTPDYYADREFNYSHINAEYMAQYDSQNKGEMLAELETSLGEMQAYVRSLKPGDLDAETGVPHYRGGFATAARTLGSLAGDYEEHAHEIREWLAGGGGD